MAEFISSGKMGRRGSRTRPVPRIDLTAMVDLAFLLITFFIMTTSLAKPKAMDLAMPVKGPNEPVPESRTMSICLGKNGKVLWYMGMPERPLTSPKLVDFSKKGLRAVLIGTSKKIFQTWGRPMIVMLKPSDHAVYADFVAALDELNITSIQSFAVVHITPKEIVMLRHQKAF